jgi:hypothetical protein
MKTNTDNIQGYDIIGDIHGHAEKLVELLKEMDYSLVNGVWTHSERKAIFVGDYIDRGPEIRLTLQIVRSMIDNGSAFGIMGNHEYNALAFNYHHPNGGHIRPHEPKNIIQHYQTIKQFRNNEEEWNDYLRWFANLPLFLELDGLRVVHACWDDEHISQLSKFGGPLTKEMLIDAHNEDHLSWKIFEEILKGKETQLKDGHFFIDKDGTTRDMCRTKWWLNPKDLTYKEYLFHAPAEVGDLEVPSNDIASGYHGDNKPIFFGHYWMEGLPKLMNSNVCCTDFSVAKNGYLAAYRWSGEKKLLQPNFVHT